MKPYQGQASQENSSDWQAKLEFILKEAIARDASDIIIKAGQPPMLRLYGDLIPMNVPPLGADETATIAGLIMNEEQQKTFNKKFEMDLAYQLDKIGRFRVNIFSQRGFVSIVMRVVPSIIKSIDNLGLPHIVKDLALRPRGLFLVTGPTGSGKSTTLAAIIDYINQHRQCHIVTIEDPIEFLHSGKKAIINQREVGEDTESFSSALKYVLRQDPDVILVGEMRDLESISQAITAAETGHLVLSTLHTTGAVQTIDRVIGVFPPFQQNQIRLQLSANLLAVISQTLMKKTDDKGRIGVYELMVATPAIKNLIREQKTHQLQVMIQTGSKYEMRTLDQALAELVKAGVIKYEDALQKSQDPPILKEMIERGITVLSAESPAT